MGRSRTSPRRPKHRVAACGNTSVTPEAIPLVASFTGDAMIVFMRSTSSSRCADGEQLAYAGIATEKEARHQLPKIPASDPKKTFAPKAQI